MRTTVQITGGTAFPISENTSGGPWEGLTKRDWFAALAMQGIIANGGEWEVGPGVGLAYQVADAMLMEREKHAQ